jgi:hypothetical protein
VPTMPAPRTMASVRAMACLWWFSDPAGRLGTWKIE